MRSLKMLTSAVASIVAVIGVLAISALMLSDCFKRMVMRYLIEFVLSFLGYPNMTDIKLDSIALSLLQLSKPVGTSEKLLRAGHLLLTSLASY